MPELRVWPDAAALYRAAAEEFARQAADAVAARGRFAVALAGGSTPRGMYGLLASDLGLRDSVPWETTHVFWGDERPVGPDHPDSNYRMAAAARLSKVPIAPANVHRIQGEAVDPGTAAADYEAVLRSSFALGADELPTFDLILLGLGTDAHTASLFPGTAALNEQHRLVVANRVDRLGATRITFTLPVINRARCVMFLVSGADKADAVWVTLHGPREPRRWPAQSIEPSPGRCLWMLDAPAASMLGGEVLP
ncbi:MAG: 6-phosphogluconolactonase [Rhodocyclaceae bacterium]